jgi:Rod binding domain-containing protein
MTIPQTAPAAAALAALPPAKPKKAEDAAKQFEALLIGQMLRSARESGSDDEEDSTSATMIDVGEQQFSQLLANNGGLGLAKLVVKGLNHANR